MSGRRLIGRNIALLLLVVSGMTMIATASSRQQSDDASPSQDTVVVDSIGDLPTSTRFEHPGSWGAPLDEHNSTGPEFTLTKAATITEIGAYVESCRLEDREHLERCQPIPSVTVNVYPQSNGKPDLAAMIASYRLSNDNNRTLMSYESVKVRLKLEPGTYYAIFSNPTNYGILMAGAAVPRKYKCRYLTMAYVRTKPYEVFTSEQYAAVRILKQAD